MLEAQIVNHSLSLIDLAKGIKKEVLLEFAKDHLKKCAYISSKKLATAYLHEYYNLRERSKEYIRLRKVLSNKFRYTIMLLTQERLIVGYSNSGLYKRVAIAKSLSTDITQPEPETKTSTCTVKLIYYQGRFVNPKFYDLDS